MSVLIILKTAPYVKQKRPRKGEFWHDLERGLERQIREPKQAVRVIVRPGGFMRKSGLMVLAAIAISFFWTARSEAQLGPKDGTNLTPRDLERVKVGEPAPDFTLEDMTGKRISLSDFRGGKNVVLVFYRGHW
jgi:cytochrome oxidase Cu insertion factor (SCO1/SenC/PrrC family)